MAGQMVNINAWKGVGGQVLSCQVFDADGAAYDLTGMDVTVSATLDSVDQFRDLACTLDGDPTTGRFTFTPSAGELANDGVYLMQATIDNGGVIAKTDVNTLTVKVPV